MVPFYGWGSTASKLEALRGGSLLFTKANILTQRKNYMKSIKQTKFISYYPLPNPHLYVFYSNNSPNIINDKTVIIIKNSSRKKKYLQ